MEHLRVVRKLSAVLFFIGIGSSANAQHCGSFLLLQNNKTITLDLYNKRGLANGKIVYKTSSRNIRGNTITATIQTRLLDKDGKLINHGTSKVKCANGTIMTDMNLFLPQQQIEQFNQVTAKVKEGSLEYPANINPGSELKDGSFMMEMDNNGIKQTLKMQIFNRKAKGVEKITTKAGSWNCVIINYQVKLNIQTGPIDIPLNYEVTEWFAPEFGIIKTVSEAGTTEIAAIQ